MASDVSSYGATVRVTLALHRVLPVIHLPVEEGESYIKLVAALTTIGVGVAHEGWQEVMEGASCETYSHVTSGRHAKI